MVDNEVDNDDNCNKDESDENCENNENGDTDDEPLLRDWYSGCSRWQSYRRPSRSP